MIEILPAWELSDFKAALPSVIFVPGLVMLVQLLATAVSAGGSWASMPYWKISAFPLGVKSFKPKESVSLTAGSIDPVPLSLNKSAEPKS